MACAACSNFHHQVQIDSPEQLRAIIATTKQHVDDGLLRIDAEADAASGATFAEVAGGEPWDDVMLYRFLCTQCGQAFALSAETYHGSGGTWEIEE